MVVCRYFVQGRCAKGAQCQFEHPGEATLANAGNPVPPRFPAGRGGHAGFRGGHTGGRGAQSGVEVKFEDVIVHDLQEVVVEWPLSCYGINASWDVGDNILHGDFSPEELRMEAYAQMRTVGNIEAYVAMLGQALAAQQHGRAEVLSDPSRAVARARIPRAQRLAALASESSRVMPATAAPVPVAAPVLAMPNGGAVAPIVAPAALAGSHSAGALNVPAGAPVPPQTGAAAGDSFSFGKIPELPRH